MLEAIFLAVMSTLVGIGGTLFVQMLLRRKREKQTVPPQREIEKTAYLVLLISGTGEIEVRITSSDPGMFCLPLTTCTVIVTQSWAETADGAEKNLREMIMTNPLFTVFRRYIQPERKRTEKPSDGWLH